jgi:mgtE-like transporter
MRIVVKILRESMLVLVVASLLSTIGGIGFEALKEKFYLLPIILIALPALNDMIGDLGIILSSKFTTTIYLQKKQKRQRKKVSTRREIREIIMVVLFVAFVMAIYLFFLSTTLAILTKKHVDLPSAFKTLPLFIVSALFIVFFLSLILTTLGFFVYKKGYDPNNILVPLATALADAFNLLLVCLFVLMF